MKPVLHHMNEHRLMFECPGCGNAHFVNVSGPTQPIWEWNGSMEFPTFSPSILVRGEYTCHSFVKEGKIQFLNDCTHTLAGQTVSLPEW